MNGQNKIVLTPAQAKRLNEYYLRSGDSLGFSQNIQSSFVEDDVPYDDYESSYIENSKGGNWLSKKIDDWLPAVVKKAYNDSIQGMATQVATGEKRFDLKNYDPSVGEDIASAVLSFFMPADLIATIAGGGLGGFAAKSAAKTALGRAANMGAKRLVQSGVKKDMAQQLIKSASERVINESATQAGAAFAYGGLSSALSKKIQNENANWQDILTDASRMSLSAAAGGAVLGRAIGRGTPKVVGYTQEALTLGTVEPILRGEVPSVKGYVESVGYAMGLTGAAASGRSLRNQFKKIKETYSLDDSGAISKLSVEDSAKQSEAARIFTEAEWYANRGQKLWSSKKGTEPELVRIIKSGQDKKGKWYKIIDEGSQEQKKIYRNTFFGKYQEENLSRIKTQKSIANLAKNLGIDADTEAFIALGNATAKLKDRELLNFNKDLFARYTQREYRRKFAEYSDSIPQDDLLTSWLGKRISNIIHIAPRRFSDKGSQAIVKTMYDISKQVTLFNSKSVKDIQELQSLIGKNENEIKQIFLQASGRKNPTKRNQKVLKRIKEIFQNRFAYAVSGGVVPSGKIKDFLPQYFKSEVKDLLFDDYLSVEKATGLMHKTGEIQSFEKEFIERIVLQKIQNKKTSKAFSVLMDDIIRQQKEKTGKKISYAEAYSMYRKWQLPSKVSPHGSIENPRNFDIPVDLLETNPATILAMYDSRLGRRVETVKRWGLNNEAIDKAILGINNVDEQVMLKAMVDKMTGVADTEYFRGMSPQSRKFIDNMLGFEAITKIALGDATAKNLGQVFVSSMPMLGVMRTMRGVIKATDKDFVKELPFSYQDVLRELTGTASTSSFMGRWSEKFAKGVGFTGINKLNALISAATAKIAIDDFVKIYNNNPTSLRGRNAKAKLKEYFDLDVDNISSLTNDDLGAAISDFSKKSQVQRDFMTEPEFLSNPKYRPFVLFKSFGIKQSSLIFDSLKKEMKLGNPLILARMALGGYLGAKLVNVPIEFITKTLTGREIYKEDDNSLIGVLEDISSVGAFGVISDFMAIEDKYSWLDYFVKPAWYSDFERGVDSLRELSKSLDEFDYSPVAVRRAAYKISRVFGTNVRRFSERFIATQPQREAQIQNEKNRAVKGILNLMITGRKEQAKKNVERWNNLNPTNKITRENLNEKDIYEEVTRRNMKVKKLNARFEDLTKEQRDFYESLKD